MGVPKRNGHRAISSVILVRSPIIVARKPESDSLSKRKKRKTWSKAEDSLLLELVKKEAPYKPNWTHVADKVNDNCEWTPRTGKQCRERWQNHLRPNIKKGHWTVDEEETIRTMYRTFGPKWSCMAKVMKNRTDNDIKNKWNSMMRTQKAVQAKYEYAQAFKEAMKSEAQVDGQVETSFVGDSEPQKKQISSSAGGRVSSAVPRKPDSVEECDMETVSEAFNPDNLSLYGWGKLQF